MFNNFRSEIAACFHRDDRVHVCLCLLDGAEDSRAQPVLLGTTPPDGRVLAHLLRYDALPSDAAHVSQLPRPHPHGQPHYQDAHEGDLLHPGIIHN